MKELQTGQLNLANGGGVVGDILYEVGYNIGYAGGWFYENVMIGNLFWDAR